MKIIIVLGVLAVMLWSTEAAVIAKLDCLADCSEDCVEDFDECLENGNTTQCEEDKADCHSKCPTICDCYVTCVDQCATDADACLEDEEETVSECYERFSDCESDCEDTCEGDDDENGD